MLSRTFAVIAATGALGLTAVACSSATNDQVAETETAMATETGVSESMGTQSQPDDDAHGEHEGHDHPADGGRAPAGMVEAANPAYPVGTEVVLSADHMPGMGGAKATIVGAFDDTFTYAISYTPTDGGDPVKNHKWVVQEELEGAGTDPYRTVQRRSSPLST